MSLRAKPWAGVAVALAGLAAGVLMTRPARSQSASRGDDTPRKWTFDYEHTLVLSEEESEESYAIYSTLLKAELPSWHLKRYAIEEWTQDMRSSPRDPLCLEVAPRQKATYQEVIADYLAKNRRRHQLEYRFDLLDYLLLPPEEARKVSDLLFARNSNTSPNADNQPFYPDLRVVYTLSEVGFNHDHTRAIVYLGHLCGAMCGGGGYAVLVRRDGKWQRDTKFIGSVCAWAS